MGGHLFDFTIKGSRYALPLSADLAEWIAPAKDVTGVTISKLFTKEGDRGVLLYDFGDGWSVSVKLETIKLVEAFSADELPYVIKGKGFGILEDVVALEV